MAFGAAPVDLAIVGIHRITVILLTGYNTAEWSHDAGHAQRAALERFEEDQAIGDVCVEWTVGTAQIGDRANERRLRGCDKRQGNSKRHEQSSKEGRRWKSHAKRISLRAPASR